MDILQIVALYRTCTASAKMLTPRSMAARPSTPNLISLALAMERWVKPSDDAVFELRPEESDRDFLARVWSMLKFVWKKIKMFMNEWKCVETESEKDDESRIASKGKDIDLALYGQELCYVINRYKIFRDFPLQYNSIRRCKHYILQTSQRCSIFL
jgi:hypothetical protein